MNEDADRAPAPTQPPARTGEGAQTALLALIRRRALQVDGNAPDPSEAPRPPLAEQ
jgi:hypothetical protein